MDLSQSQTVPRMGGENELLNFEEALPRRTNSRSSISDSLISLRRDSLQLGLTISEAGPLTAKRYVYQQALKAHCRAHPYAPISGNFVEIATYIAAAKARSQFFYATRYRSAVTPAAQSTQPIDRGVSLGNS